MPQGAVTLYRIVPGRNMRRFYRLDVQRDLFGHWCCIREWGRIGRPGRMHSIPFPTSHEARQDLDRQRSVKERRGYAQSTGQIP
jgi:predicted DNA-binding WGR domain protein